LEHEIRKMKLSRFTQAQKEDSQHLTLPSFQSRKKITVPHFPLVM